MSERVPDERILELSPAEREEQGVSPSEVRDALVEVIRTADRDEKVFENCTFPALDLDYRVIDGADNHPVVFRNCTFEEAVSVENADVALPLVFESCTIGSLDVQSARFEYDVEFHESTVSGPVAAEEARFEQDAEFDRVTFEDDVRMVETVFGDEASFTDATFHARATFHRAEFSGISNRFDDNASFEGVTFEDAVSFEQVQFQASAFVGVTFDDDVTFSEATFDGDTEFEGVTVDGSAEFTEVEFHDDANFEGTAFGGTADFEGVQFTGGARSLEDDTRFVDAVFEAEANFRKAEFRYCNFENARFGSEATFSGAAFDADADFSGVIVGGRADFSEGRFEEDADFSACTFAGPATFAGATFEGDTKQAQDNASFDESVFQADANFRRAEFSSATFDGTEFRRAAGFTGAAFHDRLDARVLASGDDRYVDLTDATIRGGTITQPRDGLVRYDLTRASLGDVTIRAEGAVDGQLPNVFRFCETVFDEFDGNEFDFAAHADHLDRNEWDLHTFDDVADRSYAVEMTPKAIEITYLNAKNGASATGDMRAAGEFRAKRQRYARKKHLEIALDSEAEADTRLKNGVRAAENGFLGVTCGHGTRIFRIFGVFAAVPALFAPLYAFGGQAFATSAGQTSLSALATPEGQATFFELLSFSYITFLTIGYGNVGPQGWAARVLVSLEVYLSVVLGGLVLYALVKRSEM